MKIFVYGTLKTNYGNNRLLSNADFVGNHVVKGFKLLNAGFPVAMPEENSSVYGELYEIKEGDTATIYSLDRLEGEGRMYHRREVENGIQMYIGDDTFWGREGLDETPKNADGHFEWHRRL